MNWTVQHIADFLRVKPKHVRDRLTKRPDFPRPVINVSRRTRAWNGEEVQKWAQGR